MSAAGSDRVHFYDHKPAVADMRGEVLAGLSANPRHLPPKYFYDARGSRLFDAITCLPEYYVTRTEIGLLKRYAGEIAAEVGAAPFLVEYGSGSTLKIRLLLEALRPVAYMPLDISREHLQRSATELALRFPWLAVHAACMDYTREVGLPWYPEGHRRVAFFPGSSIGNFEPEQATAFLRRIRDTVGADGALIIGIDLDKDAAVLEAAYDDCQGVTAAFNRNILAHINRELGGDLQPGRFLHRARYDAGQRRVEIHLESSVDQIATVAGTRIPFRAGERIHTENSYKYRLSEFGSAAASAGLRLRRSWSDARDYFAIALFDAC